MGGVIKTQARRPRSDPTAALMRNGDIGSKGHPMQTVWLYLITAVIFFGLDMIGIRFLIRPVFERHVGDLLATPMRLAPAAVFYLFYIGGLLYFVSLPALRAGAPVQALLAGALLGALCYGTYEFTNYATLARWSPSQVATDLIWGTVLTGFSAWAAVALMSGKLA
jgi:uncharacterized membrane protein